MQASELHKQLVIIGAQEIHIYRCIIKKEYDKFILILKWPNIRLYFRLYNVSFLYIIFTSPKISEMGSQYDIDDNSDFGSFYMMLNEIFWK